MIKRIGIASTALALVVAGSVWYYVFQYSATHHRNVELENTIVISATQMVNDFQTDENVANSKYLNKVVQVKGILLKQGIDQSKNITVTIKSGDPFSNIFCTLRPSNNLNTSDSVITVKGICSGFLSDVDLNDRVLIKTK